MSSGGDCSGLLEYRRRNSNNNSFSSSASSGRRRKRSTFTNASEDCASPPSDDNPCNNGDDEDGTNNDNCFDDDNDDDESFLCLYGPTILWGAIAVLTLFMIASSVLGLWSTGRGSEKSLDANLALASMGACISTNAEGLSCSVKQKVDDPDIIISGQPIIPGSAFCYEDLADFMFTLSTPAYITGVTYEHVAKEAHPEKHIESAPKIFVVNGISKNTHGHVTEVFLGNFEYLDNGSPVQTFVFKNPNLHQKFSEVKVSILANHGHHFTCVYRVQIHGKVRQQPFEEFQQQKRKMQAGDCLSC